MVHDLRLGGEFFALLEELDARIARQVAMAGCRYCAGPLHQANYPRKPRGAKIAGAAEAFRLRHSLCCGVDGCRRRALPPSLRFLGRRVYVEAVVLVASTLALVVPALSRARRLTGVPCRTLRRWATWWREAFPRSSTWAELRARFPPPPPDEATLPHSMLVRLGADLGGDTSAGVLDAALRLAARLLAPATTRSVVDGSRFVRGIGADLEGDPFPQRMVSGGVFRGT
ncbi:MAG: hypothetical protein JW751_00325 [Polyangiaceae bacterium]|nr:hypothetical protein [Polyangiaceae bacterium]